MCVARRHKTCHGFEFDVNLTFSSLTLHSAGFVGYLTNVLALEMTFRPIEFFGIELFRIKGQPWGFFGWQ